MQQIQIGLLPAGFRILTAVAQHGTHRGKSAACVGIDFTWGAMRTICYRFRLFSEENNARVVGGYRVLYQDYKDGSGDDKFEWDVTFHGPILGLVVEF